MRRTIGAVVVVVLLWVILLGAPGTWGDDSPERAVTRILCVGDSTAFALFLPKEVSWCDRLEAQWNTAFPDDPIETILFAYPGVNSSRMVASLPKALAVMRPDLVLAQIGVNDLYTETWDLEEHEARRLRLLARFVGWTQRICARHGCLGARFDEKGLVYYQDPDRPDLRSLEGLDGEVDLDAPGVDYGIRYGRIRWPMGFQLTRAGWSRQRTDSDLQELINLARLAKTEIRFLTYVGPGLYGFMNNELRLSLPEDRLLDIAADLGCPTDCADLVLSDGHPNAIGYAVIAEWLVEWLESRAGRTRADRFAPPEP